MISLYLCCSHELLIVFSPPVLLRKRSDGAAWCAFSSQPRSTPGSSTLFCIAADIFIGISEREYDHYIYSSKFSPWVLILLLILLLITELGAWGSKNNSYYFCLCSCFSLLSCFFSMKWFLFPWPVSLLSSTNLPFHHVCWTTREFLELCAYPWSYSWYAQRNNFFEDCSYPNDQVTLRSSYYIWIENTWKTIFSKK